MSEQSSKDQQSIDTGDTVKHGPTGEIWVVAYVDGDRLAWCGWPPGEARVEHCTLVEKATAEYRDKLLRQLADMRPDGDGYDRRQRLASLRIGETT